MTTMSAPTNWRARAWRRSGSGSQGSGVRTVNPRPDPEICPWSKLLQDRLRAGDIDAGLVLDIERLHHAVIDDHRIALRAMAHMVGGQDRIRGRPPGRSCHCRRRASGSCRRLPTGVAQAFMTWTSFTAVQATVSTPFALMASVSFTKAGQMIHAAGRREGAGHGEEHHLAARKYRVGREFLRCRRRSSVMNSASGRRSPTLIMFVPRIRRPEARKA